MNKFNELINGLKIQPHRENLADDIILKASRMPQKTTESFINIFRSLFTEFLRPKLAFSLAALVLAVFLVGLNNSGSTNETEVTDSDFVIEEIYYAGGYR